MNRVVSKVRKDLTGTDPDTMALKEELAVFISQEGNHYQIHESYNAILKKHYPGLVPMEKAMADYYARIFKTKSMRFLTGFGETFEMFGPIYARIWLDDYNDILVQSQPIIVNLWKWHWSEEYEHRTSLYRAHKLYNSSYFYRIYMMAYTMRVLKSFQYGMMNHMLEVDRQSMTEAERRESIKSQKRWTLAMSKKIAGPLLKGVIPFYSPIEMPEPKNYRGFITWFEQNEHLASQTNYAAS